MSDENRTNGEEIVETEEEKKEMSELEKFALVEEILAGWELKEKIHGGRFCTFDELFEMVEKESPSSFSLSSLRDFISARPHLFRITLADEIAVRMKEDRANFIQVVRFIRDSPSPVTREELIERFWDKESERLRLREVEENKKRDEEERSTRWMTKGGTWAMAGVLRSIKRGGDGVFKVDGDKISLTSEALANDSFFDDIYLKYDEEVVRRLQEKLDNAKSDEGEKKDDKAVRKQRQCNSSQTCFLAISREAKPKYSKGLIVTPGDYHAQTAYVLPNHMRVTDATGEKSFTGLMMVIRAHDVYGDEQLANRFRADEMFTFPLTSLNKAFGELSHDFRDSQVRKLLYFSSAVKSRTCEIKGENQPEELARLLSEQTGVEVAVIKCDAHEFSDYIIPTKKAQFEWNSRCVYEKFLIDELDHMIRSGIKSRVEHGEEKEEKPYPIDSLLKDVINRSITRPDAIPLLTEETREELINELELRPHLYVVHERDFPSASVSFRNRESIDRLLQCLDTDGLWTMDSLRSALGEGKAGEEWKDEPIEELVCNFLYQVMHRDRDFMNLAMRRSREGMWMRVPPSMMRRPTREKKIVETETKEKEKKYGGWTVNEEGVKMKGRGARGTRVLTPVSDENEEEYEDDKENEEGDDYEEEQVDKLVACT